MNLRGIPSRVKFRLQREAAARLSRRPLLMRNAEPLISFTFDDFPRSALLKGGAILRTHGVKGTFFASFGLMGRVGPTGEIFNLEDIGELVGQGHELGCHTYDHCHAWDTDASEFEASIVRNREALEKHLTEACFRTFSYPISCPRPTTKRRAGRHFSCCRGGGQIFNSTISDLNCLKAFFIEQSKGNFNAIERLIEDNVNQRGWLIFATHDVSNSPTPFGCTPALLEKIVRCSLQSGATVLPVFDALQVVKGTGRGGCEAVAPQSDTLQVTR